MCVYVVNNQSQGVSSCVSDNQEVAFTMMLMCISLTALIGISTAYIMKRLDNMVKLYAESLSSMLMTVACVTLFPKRFTIDAVFIISLLLTFAAIFIYEKDNLKIPGGLQKNCVHIWKSLCHQKVRLIVLIILGIISCIAICLVVVYTKDIIEYLGKIQLGAGTEVEAPTQRVTIRVRHHKMRKMPALKQ